MADKLRSINTHFWDDNYIVQLDPIEKLLFLYLLSNTLTNIAGVYEITFRRIAFDTGIDSEMVKKIITRFEKDGKAGYVDGYIILTNFQKNQRLNANMKKGVREILKGIPESVGKALEGFRRLSNIPLKNEEEEGSRNRKRKKEIRIAPSDKSDEAVRFAFEDEFLKVTEQEHEAFQKAYPSVDLQTEYAKANAWQISNPAKRKVAHNRFMNNWLCRVQEKKDFKSISKKESIFI